MKHAVHESARCQEVGGGLTEDQELHGALGEHPVSLWIHAPELARRERAFHRLRLRVLGEALEGHGAVVAEREGVDLGGVELVEDVGRAERVATIWRSPNSSSRRLTSRTRSICACGWSDSAKSSRSRTFGRLGP